MKVKIQLLLMLTAITGTKLLAQGCSDAGFCTIGALHPVSALDTSYRHNAKISVSYGSGEQGTNIIQLMPELEFGFFKNNSIQIKVPYIMANGNLGSNSGIGDLVFSVTQKLISKKNSSFSATIGTKLPTGITTAKTDGIDLPMPYQTGLGTTDLILGASYQFKKWNLGAGYQMVLINHNKNEFAHFKYVSDGVRDKYFESNHLDRSDDALVRVERSFRFKKLNVSPGLLAIYHLQKDKIENPTGNAVTVNGSEGLTLNVTGSLQYELSKRTGLNLLFGTPVVVRETRPDGLTREVVVTAAFNYQFGK